MPLVDMEQGCKIVNSTAFFKKYLEPVVKNIPTAAYLEMTRVIDDALSSLAPSQKSQLVWTKCAALVGYSSTHPDADVVWQHAFEAVRRSPNQCNQLVGSLIYWRISLFTDTWITSKTHDHDKFHPHRSYWINNSWSIAH